MQGFEFIDEVDSSDHVCLELLELDVASDLLQDGGVFLSYSVEDVNDLPYLLWGRDVLAPVDDFRKSSFSKVFG